MSFGNPLGVLPTHIFHLANLLQTLQNLGVPQLAISQDGTSRLYRLDDLVGHVASEGETSRVGVYLHSSTERLLCSGRHSA